MTSQPPQTTTRTRMVNPNYGTLAEIGIAVVLLIGLIHFW
jgi:hypothetical protein